MERQYGRVPPMGAEIYMTRYRVGGGSLGNVQAGQLRVLKSSIPYVKQVTNYKAATGGVEAESLEEAMVRVPALLRTRKTAISPEDFERTARDFRGGGYIHRAHCITTPHLTTPGVVRLLVIPQVGSPLNLRYGTAPERLLLAPEVDEELKAYLDMHKALGIRVLAEPPDYVGVRVQAEVYPLPQYRDPSELEPIVQKLQTHLHRFLNPVTGGSDGQGWPLGRPVQVSDIVTQLQQVSEVHSVGQVQLFKIQRYRYRDRSGWMELPDPMTKVEIGELQTVTSWFDPQGTGINHTVVLMEL